MAKLLIVTLVFITFCSCNQTTQSLDKDKERIDNVCDQFMRSFASGKIYESLQLLKKNSVISPVSIDTLQVEITNQTKNIFQAYGKILSSEFIIEKKIKDFISKRFYILKFDKYFLKFSFTIYNSGGGWTITSFNYNEEFAELLY